MLNEQEITQDFDKYYRIQPTEKQTVCINFQTAKFIDNLRSYPRGLHFFEGFVKKRQRMFKKKYQERFKNHWQYKIIAIQSTVMDSICDYATKKNIDMWNATYLEMEITFHSASKKSYAIIHDLKILKEKQYNKEKQKTENKIAYGGEIYDE